MSKLSKLARKRQDNFGSVENDAKDLATMARKKRQTVKRQLPPYMWLTKIFHCSRRLPSYTMATITWTTVVDDGQTTFVKQRQPSYMSAVVTWTKVVDDGYLLKRGSPTYMTLFFVVVGQLHGDDSKEVHPGNFTILLS